MRGRHGLGRPGECAALDGPTRKNKRCESTGTGMTRRRILDQRTSVMTMTGCPTDRRGASRFNSFTTSQVSDGSTRTPVRSTPLPRIGSTMSRGLAKVRDNVDVLDHVRRAIFPAAHATRVEPGAFFRPFGRMHDAHRLTTRARPRPCPPPRQDFYENLSLSEKIVDGHVKLMLVRCVRFASPRFTPPSPRAPPSQARFGNLTSARVPLPRLSSPLDPHPHPLLPGAQPEVESSDDEEDAWAKWEAKNHEQRERRRLMGELRGARALASETSRAVRDARTRSRSPEGGRRGPRAKRDPIYAELLDRRDQNAERPRGARAAVLPRRRGVSSGRNPRSPDRAPARDGPRDARDRPRVFAPSPRPGTHPETRPRPRTTTRATTRGEGGRRRAARGFAATRRSLSRPSSAASHRAPRRPPSRAASEGAVSPGRGRPASRYGEYDYDGDKVAFGCHFTYEAEAARARRGVVPPRHSAKTTTTFDPPRLFTSSRPMERVRNRRAMERAWRRQSSRSRW